MPNWLDKILGFLPDFLGLGAGIFGGVNNAQMQRETNETNMAIAKMTNAAQAREHEKAYERSKATNQVNLLQQAGMSKAGALQTLNGGGSYQPAPMQSSQAQAPQLDLSTVTNGLLQIGENARQRKAADKLQEKQIKAAADAQKAQFEENEKERQHDLEMQAREHTNTNRNVDNRLNFDREQWRALESYRKEQERQLKISNDLQDRLSDINYQQAVENVGLTKAQKFLTYTQEDKLYEELQDFLDAADSRKSARETQIAEDIVRQLCAATDFEYKYLTYEYINSLEGRERENAIIRAESWWRLAETRFGGVAQVLGKVAMAAGLIYFGKGAGLRWMQKLGAPKSAPIGFG